MITAMLAAAAVATASSPHAAPAPPPAHVVTVTDADLSAIFFAISRVGERCGPTGEDFCRVQLSLDDFARRIGKQIAGEKRPEPHK